MGFPVAAVTLPGSNYVQVFVGGGSSQAVTLTQTGLSSTDGLDSAWSGPSSFAMSTEAGAADYTCIAACQDHNGQANLWAMPTIGHTLMTRQKASATAQWSAPTPFNPQPPVGSSGPISVIAAGKSIPGRIQLFAALPDEAAGHCTMITTWETEENSGVYYDWTPMEGAPDLALQPAITCVNAPDGRLQLWATSSQGNLMTCWKSGQEKNAPWTTWEQAGAGIKATSAAGGVDSSGLVQMWACASGDPDVMTGTVASSPSQNITWSNLFLASGAEVGTPYNVAAGHLSSGHLIVFLAAGVYNSPDKYALYATLDNGGLAGWVQLANLN